MPTTPLTWLLPDGDGGARLDAGSVRVPGGLPGDTVRWTEVERRGRTVVGHLDEIVAASPDRRSAPCPWDASCGGCDLAALDPDARRRHLAAIVGRALGWDAPVPVETSPDEGYRARVKLAIEGTRVGYRAARSHELVEIERCAIARPEVQAAHTALRAWLAEHPEAGLDGVELRSDGSRVVQAFTGRPDATAREALASLGDVALEGRPLHGDPVLLLEVLGVPLRASARAFYQVNLDMNATLTRWVRDRVLEASPERVLDLYSGIGNLGLPIAEAGVPVVAVEREGQATADLRAVAEERGLSVEVLGLPAERFEPSRTPYDVAVLDPPRAGAGKVLGRVLRNRPRRVVYVSCHVRAAARELRQQAKGYRLTEVRAFDMFPQTHHVEVGMVLERA